MTNQERAEKIFEICSYSDPDVNLTKSLIVAQLDEAQREAISQAGITAHGIASEGVVCSICFGKYKEGFAAAREKAAEIAEDNEYCDCGSGGPIAERIRAMTMEDK